MKILTTAEPDNPITDVGFAIVDIGREGAHKLLERARELEHAWDSDRQLLAVEYRTEFGDIQFFPWSEETAQLIAESDGFRCLVPATYASPVAALHTSELSYVRLTLAEMGSQPVRFEYHGTLGNVVVKTRPIEIALASAISGLQTGLWGQGEDDVRDTGEERHE